MTLTLAAAPTALERLEQAITRMQARHHFERVDNADDFNPPGLAALLLTDDPQRNLEVLDACVILPEALKSLPADISRHVADAQVSAPLMQRFGIARAPAVVLLRHGEYQGALNGIRDWAEYQSEFSRLLNGPAQPRPIGIPVRALATGACS